MNRKNVIWNMIGSICYSIAPVILMSVVKQIFGIETGNDFAFALTLATTLLAIGYFEVRLFQVTDGKNEYEFLDYRNFRMITTFLMILFGFIYMALIGAKEPDKARLIGYLILYKASDAYADVYEGDYQKLERLDLSGMSLSFRTAVSILVFFVSSLVLKNIDAACIMTVVTAWLIVLILNRKIEKKLRSTLVKADRRRMKKLFRDCFLLAVGAFIYTYITNCCKYAVDRNCSEFNYVFSSVYMPTCVINLVGGMMFKPVLTTLTGYYERHEMKNFVRLIEKLVFLLGVLTIICLIGAYLIGIPVLSILYAVDLSDYKRELLILLVGGGMTAAGNLLYYALVVMRVQKKIFVIYVITLLSTLNLPYVLAEKYGLAGASFAFVVVMLVQDIFFCILLAVLVKREEKKWSHENSRCCNSNL